jgi:thiamine pyrophosphokinase
VRALVIADGAPPDRAALDRAWPGWDDGLELVVAADGGARHAAALGRSVDRWVGDGDSLGSDGVAALRAAGVPVRLVPVDKDASDTELAILDAVDLGADDITIVGALGGARFDHGLANVTLLDAPALVGRQARLLEPGARVSLLRGPSTIVLEGQAGDIVTLLPLGDDADGVTTEGLRYPLADETLSAGRTRGLSNARLVGRSRISLRGGRLLVVETPATLSP